jgi:hypothetical protein
MFRPFNLLSSWGYKQELNIHKVIYSNTTDIQGGKKVSVHLTNTAQKTHKNILNSFSHLEYGHYRTHSQCGPCYTEHGPCYNENTVFENNSACQ